MRLALHEEKDKQFEEVKFLKKKLEQTQNCPCVSNAGGQFYHHQLIGRGAKECNGPRKKEFENYSKLHTLLYCKTHRTAHNRAGWDWLALNGQKNVHNGPRRKNSRTIARANTRETEPATTNTTPKLQPTNTTCYQGLHLKKDGQFQTTMKKLSTFHS